MGNSASVQEAIADARHALTPMEHENDASRLHCHWSAVSGRWSLQKDPPIPITAITGIAFKALEKETPVISNVPNMPGHVDNFAIDATILPFLENAKAYRSA